MSTDTLPDPPDNFEIRPISEDARRVTESLTAALRERQYWNAWHLRAELHEAIEADWRDFQARRRAALDRAAKP